VLNKVRLLVACIVALGMAGAPASPADQPEVLPHAWDSWHPLAGMSLGVTADTMTLFVADFEKGLSSSGGTKVEPLESAGVEFIQGLVGKAVRARRLTYPGAQLINPERTYFGLWIRPDFDPNTDRNKRTILQMGDGRKNSLVMRTNGAGMLMLIMSDDDYSSACRKDISSWRRGEWHHVGGWFNKKAHELWLFADGYAADSTVMYHNDGLRPEDLTTLYLGCGPEGESGCVIDEVAFAGDDAKTAREHHYWMLGIATLAAEGKVRAAIKPNAWGVAANPKAVAGTVRVFGLECSVPRAPRITPQGLTCDSSPESSAKELTIFNMQPQPSGWHPYSVGERIEWSSSDPEIAAPILEKSERTGKMQPKASGMFDIKKPGRCKIVAKMGGRKWAYDLEVVDRNRPDLLVQYISRFPRYNDQGVKDRPAAGDPVEFEVHVANRGFAESQPASLVLRVFESGGLADLDARKKKLVEISQPLKALKVHEQTAIRFPWIWRDDPCNLVATIETDQPEISTHNNERGYLTVRSRNIYLIVDTDNWELWHTVNNNHTGTFAIEDWLEAQRESWDNVLREAVYPASSPYGVQWRLHIDYLHETNHDAEDWGKNDPGRYWDGGWICTSKSWAPAVWAGSPSHALMHEWGHGAFAGADLYSYSIWEPWCHIRDDDGNKVARTGAFPGDQNDSTLLYLSSATHPSGTNGRFICATMMHSCAPYLHEGMAGHIQHNSDLRCMDIWQIHRRMVPLIQNMLVVRDIEGNPIEGAELAIYQESYGVESNSGRSPIPDVIKFAGKTDKEGKWIYPYETAVSYDDPETDQVERVFEVASPLSMAKFPWPASPGVWSNNSMQVIAVRKGAWTEYHVLDLFQFAAEAYRNNRLRGQYIIQTNLPADMGNVETKPFKVEPAPDPNKRPVIVVAQEMRVQPGAEVDVDASKSYDPEGKPVSVHWILGGWRQEFDIRQLGGKVDTDQGPVLHLTAPNKSCEIKLQVYCCDTVRVSETKDVKVIVGDGAPAGAK